MRLIPMTSAAIVALVGSALVDTTANAATAGGDSSFILAAEETTSSPGVQGKAPHTGTGLGTGTPPAEGLGSTRPGTMDPNKVQGTAPHTGTGLGTDTQPPPQTAKPETPAEMKDLKKTTEDNVGGTEKKKGEKPTP